MSKHVGTRLFTIIEQKSVPSLKTSPSIWEIQRRTFTLQPQLSSEVAQARHSRTARRRCYSADDSILLLDHNKSELSEASSVDAIARDQRFACEPTLPNNPPYQPPERVQTPKGLPRWPGETDHDQPVVGQVTTRTSRRDLLVQYLRSPAPPSRPKFSEVLRGERTAKFDRPVRTGTRFWRPPSSGHTTRRYEDLESHPFSFVPIAKPHGVQVTRRQQPAAVEEITTVPGSFPPIGTNQHIQSIQDSTMSQSDAPIRSLRALRYAGQHAVAVSAHRASAQASTRSAAVPLNIRTSPSFDRAPDLISPSPDMGTMRTVDLFESFPSPPTQQLARSQMQTAKRSSWSLFPSSDRYEGTMDDLPRPRKRQAPADSEESGAVNVAIRGESQARYRHSGTPIYDPDGVSLRSIDREYSNENEVGSSDLAMARSTSRRRTESQRAISNGALRFSTRLESPTRNTFSTSVPIQNVEYQSPLRRKSSETHQLCRHKLAKLRSLQKKYPNLVPATYDTTHLDGASSPISPPPPIVAQDYAFAGPSISTRARASIAPVQPLDRPPTTTTFVTAPNGATTFTTSPTIEPFGRSSTLASVQSASTMPGRA